MEPIENEKHNMHINPCIGVMIEDDRYGYQYQASLYECDNGEMYLEANFAPMPGSTFSIIFDNIKVRRQGSDGNKAANRDLKEFKALFAWANRQTIIQHNPVLNLEPYPE